MYRGRSGSGRAGLSDFQRRVMNRIDEQGFVTVAQAFRIKSGTRKLRWEGASKAKNFSAVYRAMGKLVDRGLVLVAVDSRPLIWVTSEVLRGRPIPGGLRVERDGRHRWHRLALGRPRADHAVRIPLIRLGYVDGLSSAIIIGKAGFEAWLVRNRSPRR